MNEPTRVGLFGGSFDPIHHGHLILARDAMERLKLDRVLFIPATLSPHKPSSRPAAAQTRAEMVAAAIADEPGFALEDCELGRQGPSFSVDTVELIRARYPQAELFYLLGHDNVAQLHTWRRIEDLRALVQFVIFGRGDHPPTPPFLHLERRLDISATEVRQRVAQGASIRYLVPDAVRAIIARDQLYQEIRH